MNNRRKIIFSTSFILSIAIASSIASIYYSVLKKQEETFIASNNLEDSEPEKELSENIDNEEKVKNNDNKISINIKENEKDDNQDTEKHNDQKSIQSNYENNLEKIEYDKELEEAPFLEVNVLEDNLRFQYLTKEKFYIDNHNKNLNYFIDSYYLSEDKENIIFNIIIEKQGKTKEYQINNFTNFLTEKKYYNNLLNEVANNITIIIEEHNKNLNLSDYKKSHFAFLNSDERTIYKIKDFSIAENQEDGLRSAKVLINLSIEEFSLELEKTVNWNFIRDRDIVNEVILNKNDYKNNLELMLDKTKIPSELVLNQENLTFYIEDKGVSIYYNRIESLNDYTGNINIEFIVKKNNIIDFISFEFNEFNKVVKQEEYNNNSSRIKMWIINAINQNSSWAKEYVFDDVGYGGKIGRNYWYRNSDNFSDIYFEIIKKDNIPIYIHDLELTFMNYSGYYKDDNYYRIEYKENNTEEWKQADINTKRIEYETLKAIPHVKNTISIKKEVISIRIVFEKGKQPNYYVHISRIMPYIKKNN